MKTFIYFFKNNPNDILGKIKAEDIVDAISIASQKKNMGINEFLEIFEIYERK